MKVFIITLTLAVVASGGSAQDYAFKVLVNKGKNEVKAGDTWQPLKTGATLKSNDEVKVVDNSYLGLVHVSGKPLELKTAGNYKVVDLSAKMNGGTSVLNKYTDFILSSNGQKQNRMTATGAVHRGSFSTRIYLPKNEAVFFGDKVIIDWEKEESKTPVVYIVKLKSIFGDELFATETTERTVTINFGEKKFFNEDNIIVDIYPKGKEDQSPDPGFMIKKLSAADKERIKVLLSEIEGQAEEGSALSKLIMAGFYEQNKLLIDAATSYLEAIELAPDVEQFRVDYNNFLLRNGIKAEEQKKD
jgi:hypothetical protein